VNIIFNRKLT